jgi:cytochrome P450
MRYVPAFCLLLLFSHSAAGQVLPTSNGSCSVSPSGVQSCDWMTGVSLSEGAFWQKPRKLVQPSFRHESIAAYAEVMAVPRREKHVAFGIAACRGILNADA